MEQAFQNMKRHKRYILAISRLAHEKDWRLETVIIDQQLKFI